MKLLSYDINILEFTSTAVSFSLQGAANINAQVTIKPKISGVTTTTSSIATSAPPSTTFDQSYDSWGTIKTTKSNTLITTVSVTSSSANSLESPHAAANSRAFVPTKITSTKKGICYNNSTLASLFKDRKSINWAYNWGQTAVDLPPNWEFVPMLWSHKQDLIDTWEQNVDRAIKAGAMNFLAFNEPDINDQANMTVTQSVNTFREWMNPIKKKYPNVRLSTPAVSNGANGMGIDYLVNWQTACKGSCSADFAAIHWYEKPSQVQYFKDHITEAYNRTGLPIWVTEFGTLGGTDDEIIAFSKEVLPWMDSQPWIERYSFFMAAEGYMIKNHTVTSFGSFYGD